MPIGGGGAKEVRAAAVTGMLCEDVVVAVMLCDAAAVMGTDDIEVACERVGKPVDTDAGKLGASEEDETGAAAAAAGVCRGSKDISMLDSGFALAP